VIDLRRVAGHPAVRQFLLDRSPEARTAAEAQLRALIAPGQQVTELWSHTDQRLIALSSSPIVEEAFPRGLPTTGSGVRIDQTRDRLIVSTLAEDIHEDSATRGTLGYVVVRRPVTSGAGTDVLNRLMGSGARVEIGGRGTESWRDLSGIVTAPRVDLSEVGERE
jgi:hypothetical protein